MNSVAIELKKDCNIKTRQEERPWGMFEQFTENKKTTVKMISILSGKRLSLQYHIKRDEFWKIIKGRCLITIGEEVFSASEGDEFYIARGSLHRIQAVDGNAEVLEICIGPFNEDDIVRVEDDYYR